ncbi:MAG: type I-B CRISPR-associated endonuclease Cas1b [Patescibacteria group bacterium]|nr:type I-B CRISPR-associated endonuclease Cas1b [Patescibacteria group bacterium]
MKNYYIFKSGRISRKDNSVFLETQEGNIPIPINDIESIYFFGEIDFNTKAINFFAQNGILVHFFNYYGWYTGTFYPKEELLSGNIIVKQAEYYLDHNKRIEIAKEFVKGAMNGFIYNMKRYKEKINLEKIKKVEEYEQNIDNQQNIDELMGLEGNAREIYYSSFPEIINQEIEFEKRVKNPPDNMMNALISFLNSLVYTAVIKEIYRTQLNPTISYLHEPSYRRFSLSLDVSEIFKPIYGDRIIFEVLNNNKITKDDFDKDLNYCYLNEKGRKVIIKDFDEKLKTTVYHKNLKKRVSFETIIRLELYKLIKHLLGEQKYKVFKIWW